MVVCSTSDRHQLQFPFHTQYFFHYKIVEHYLEYVIPNIHVNPDGWQEGALKNNNSED
jgi:hypothetical protein